MPPIPVAGRSAARFCAVLAAAVAVSACSATRPASGPDAGPDVVPETYPSSETFDASPYDAAPPAPVEIVHDVPRVVMAGRVVVPRGAGTPAPTEPAEPVARQVEGYRVQVFTGSNRVSADAARDRATAWWARARRRAGAPVALDVAVVYLQPYYRVRLGGFESESDAEAALAFVRGEYPEAFLVPDLVTVVD